MTADMKTGPPVGRYTAVRVEFLTHPTLPRGGPGRSIYGTHALTEFRCFYTPPSGERRQLEIASASADIDPPDQPMEFPFVNTREDEDPRRLGPIGYAIDKDLNTAWHTNTRPADRNRDHKAVFVLAEPLRVEPGGVVTFRLKQDHGGWNNNDNQTNLAGRYRFSLTEDAGPRADPMPRLVRQTIAKPTESWDEVDWDRAFAYWRNTRPEWSAANEAIDSLLDDHPEGVNQYVVLSCDEPRTTRVLLRGDFLKPGDEVTPGVPDFLHPLPEDGDGSRLTLARWLTSRRSPTTARTLVNRVWQAYFGTGLVESPEDLGSQAAAPSHPELLDWLAVEFMENGWSLKALHRQIVLSATYQQSSRLTPAMREKDPSNRLLGRMARLRVDAESVRDIALAASGLLNRQVGGPTIFPPAPGFLFVPPASYGTKPWLASTGSDAHRRSLYVQRYRSSPYPTLQVFDAPTGAASCVRRARSNTPVQALTLLNEPQLVECARALATKLLDVGPGDAERFDEASLRTRGRLPRDNERALLIDLVELTRKRFGDDPSRAVDLVGQSEDPVELAAWTLVARAMLNLDETITRP